jgi:hypothetical protein
VRGGDALTFDTLRLMLIKVAARITELATRIKLAPPFRKGLPDRDEIGRRWMLGGERAGATSPGFAPVAANVGSWRVVHRVAVDGLSPERAVNEAITRVHQLLGE